MMKPAPKLAAVSQENPFLSGNFAPIEAETTAFDLPIEGRVPEELEGRLVLIAPNPVVAPNPATYQWFAGNGMTHGLRLRGGRAEWYRSRFVLGTATAAALGRKEIPGPGRGSRDGAVNTSIINFGGRDFAIGEAGDLPVELSYELESVARSDFDGTLTAGFSGHTRLDPKTGEHHLLAYEPGRPSLHYLVVDKAGSARMVAELSVPHHPALHDLGITATSVVVLDLSVTFRPDISGPVLPYAWLPDVAPRVGLLPRTGDVGGLQWFDAPPDCWVSHVLNAYDDGDLVVLDVVRQPRSLDRNEGGPSVGAPILARWILDRTTSRLSESILDDHGCDFPRINPAYDGLPYRYGYTAQVPFGSAMKHDVIAARTEIHDYGPGRATAEPVFVPRRGSIVQDDGWVMSYVYDAGRNASDVVVLDAQNFAGPPVATIHLPVRVPFGFHGNWAPDLQTSDSEAV